MKLCKKIPEVTVIVTVYNSEKYLKKCLSSLVNQTLPKDELEVLIINDGSTDNSMDIILNFVKQYPNFKVISQKNMGLFASRKKGLQMASGNYIGWVDSDDFVDPSMFEELLNVCKKYHSDLSYCKYDFYPQKIKTKELWFREFRGHKNVDFVERNSQPWNKLVSSNLLKKLDIAELFESCFDEAYIKCLLYAENPVTINKVLYHYRVGNASMSSSYTNVSHYKKFINSSRHLRSAMSKLCKQDNYWKEYFDFRILYYELLTMIVAANASDYKVYKEMKKDKQLFVRNRHFKHIIKRNYGNIKYFIMTKAIPSNYLLAKVICKVSFN